MAARLTREPFNLSFDQIARLTDDQILNVLFRPDPEDRTTLADGTVVAGTWTPLTFAEWERTWKACGKDHAWIVAEWEKTYGPPEPAGPDRAGPAER